MNTQDHINLSERFSARNYHPLPVVLARGEGVWVWDVDGNRYMDCLSAYSAVNQGHCHPAILQTMMDQARLLTLTSRAFRNDQLGLLYKEVCELTHSHKMLPMNSGAEAVETVIKAVRKWGYTVKGVPENKAEIIVCANNFHGRTIAAVAMSDEPQYQQGFGPFPPGFLNVEYGNIDALANAINENTAAFIVEPIQGEGGIVIPPEGYLRAAAQLCREHNVLLIADEIQTGLGRTGKLLACQHEGVNPDGLILGKALGGGILPVSMFLARRDVMEVFTPGDHGSTFGGNPLGAAVGLEALNILIDEKLADNSARMGRYLLDELAKIDSPVVKEVRGRGLFIGLEINPELASARAICEALMERGLLSKETHQTVVRLAPPLVIGKAELDWAIRQIREVIAEIDDLRLAS